MSHLDVPLPRLPQQRPPGSPGPLQQLTPLPLLGTVYRHHLGAGKVGEGGEELGQGVGQEVDGLELQLVTDSEGARAGNKPGQSIPVVSQYLLPCENEGAVCGGGEEVVEGEAGHGEGEPGLLHAGVLTGRRPDRD